MTVDEFIKKTYQGALAVEQKYGIPALAIMAQSAQETGWGSSAPGNMYFGIKAGTSWTGKKQLLWTHEFINGASVKVQAWFRAYDSAAQSFEDYAHLIINNSRYHAALQYPDDPEAYIKAVAAAGYATDPNYANSIISIISSIKKKLKK